MQASVHRLPAVSVAETLDLRRGVVDLWYYFYEGIDDTKLLSAHEALMTPDERKRHDSFQFERDRRLFLATRALVRTVLSSYTTVAPETWRFAIGEHGKPRVRHPVVTPFINFNLSNTPGLAVCAVSVVHDSLGVDAERIDQPAATDVAEQHFSSYELCVLRALPTIEQHRCFFAYWTLKESYIKARGLGLGIPLNQFSFILDDGPIRVAFDRGCEDDATCWRFALLDASPLHVIAVGVDTGGVPLSLRATQFVPLDGATS